MATKQTPKPVYVLSHTFMSKFGHLAMAFWSKYQEQNSRDTVTLADVQQISDDELQFVRRHDDGHGRIEYETIRMNRSSEEIQADLYSTHKATQGLAERCLYKYNTVLGKMDYNLFVYRELFNKILRKMGFSWGTSTLEKLIAQMKREYPNL